ncbi:oligo-1,6-glucosidase [Clostridium pasteurianum DSM 525 = ATCC 6013]|uniref:Oligo-1,6-glucosidase n=1 Tax=Clostridium pasteurianum DSM 525 = ATCC 6013 TaxID=1262449 RepID=A0A0H3J4K3_CLOPA|nr:alpha-glucosidase [Clostridium pasteurianum]AJA47877.1 oligo-1,6-glucosidase [Clostridium pasteurianum DSM 525 = ATCC 6013]AJA51865.1 oligo-1,6-glucosidase [Clostridium pasteurianum DSM 525 = ATCC 6013]AOZ75168.1 glucan 1,6-alpha-glucosidase [Clostridium pasteurianum DSM 525 = ATCC 6013]AOZ78963.1 glucan 1,6-alpha-glucosidase [Clostridium pasteurianum]ELP59780.1 alpha amylase [Clostridium pasteurianum DSM 525 = ATCC 6013]
MEKKWWHNKAVYQIYPRSFFDSNGDGIGDLKGIMEKLEYLKKLGVHIIWMCPINKSPNDDNGYDISDYYDIMDEFGTMKDMELLIEACKNYGISIIMDLVLNHSSDEHKWFIEAKSSRESPYRDFYIWRDSINGKVPNELKAFFGGSAWEFDEESGQYYLHSFSKKQPDLNWENSRMRGELYDMINFWIDKGIKGFRLDAIDNISKDLEKKIMNSGPKIHEYLKKMNENTFGKHNQLVTVGETGGATPELAKLYTDPERHELDMIFQFELMGIDGVRSGDWIQKEYSLIDLKNIMTKWQTELNEIGWNSLFWGNHDYPRVVSRFGDHSEDYRILSAKMLATMLHGMKGIPYIYQGEEIGMTNIKFTNIEDYRDVETKNFYKRKIDEGCSMDEIMSYIYRNSRDNARTPMQWDDTEHGGFTKGVPWIKENSNYTTINVKQCLEDKNSIFYHYQKLLKLRQEKEVFVYGSYELIYPEHPQVFAYRRTLEKEKILVICNFYGTETIINIKTNDKPKLLISNYRDTNINIDNLHLRPYEAVIYQMEGGEKE